MTAATLELERVARLHAVCRLHAAAPVPAWVEGAGGLVSVTRTDRELSIIAPQDAVPGDVEAERGWVVLRGRGPLPFTAVGVLARLASALAAAEVPMLAVATYETDYVLFKREHEPRAMAALSAVATVAMSDER